MSKLTLKNLKESDIQHLYYQFPYLIDKRFMTFEKEQFVKIKSGIIDILVQNEDELVVIELKKVPLTDSHVLQLYQYMREEKELVKEKKISGILIGKKTKKNFENLLQSFEFNIEVKILDEDVPLNSKICSNCRYANDVKNKICFNCSGIDWL